MTRLPVPTAVRLWAAALLCAVPLGLTWSVSITPGTTLPGDCGYTDGPYCVPDAYLPGSSSVTSVAQSPARVFLVAALAALALCAATRRTAATRRLARWGCGSAAVAAALAAGHGARGVVVCTLAALALVVPAVRGSRRPRAQSTDFGVPPRGEYA